LPCGHSVHSERLAWALKYKRDTLKSIWMEPDVREILTNDAADKFAEVLLVNMLGESKELQKFVYSPETYEEDSDMLASENDDADDLIYNNKKLPEWKEPAYGPFLAQLYELLDVIYNSVAIDSPLYKALHSRHMLHNLMLLLHSPDPREKIDIQRILQKIIIRVTGRFIDAPFFAGTGTRIILGLITGGLQDIYTIQTEIALRPATHLLHLFFELLKNSRYRPLESLVETTFLNMVIPLIDLTRFEYFMIDYGTTVAAALDSIRHHHDLSTWPLFSSKLIKSLWQGPSRTDGLDNERLVIIFELFLRGLISPHLYISLMQKLFGHYRIAPRRNQLVFLGIFQTSDFLTLFSRVTVFGTEIIKKGVIREIYSNLCNWYLSRNASIENAIFSIIETLDKNLYFRSSIMQDHDLRSLRAQIGYIQKTK
jgi:hypothetical protein